MKNYSKLPRLRVHAFGYLFEPSWFMFSITALLFCFLVSLGFWQLDRAKQKYALLQQYQEQNQSSAISPELNKINKTWQYRSISLTGRYDNEHIIFIDNQFYQHRPGYHVLTPFQTHDGVILLNRGWIPNADRSRFPMITPVNQTVTLTGLISFPTKPFLLNHQLENPGHWPVRLQAVELPQIENLLHRSLFPFVVLLLPEKSGNFIRDWHPVTMPPTRHIGYAVQWFALATTLIILFIVTNCKRTLRKDEK